MVGKRIKAYLAENGIKQSFLSEKTGISNDVLSKILAGTRDLKAIEYARICRALKVDFETFIYEDD